MFQDLFSDFRTIAAIGVIIAVTLSVAFVFNFLTSRYLKDAVLKRQLDPTSYRFARYIISALIYVVGFALALVQIPAMKTVGHSLLAGAGIISLVAGLASQQALSNIMSGILIVLFKPFKINDRITLRGSFVGIVEDINLRQVVIRDFENNRIIIPNSVISTEVIVNTHLTDSRVCKMLEIGIGYGANIDHAMAVIREEAMKHPLQVDNRSPEEIQENKPEVMVRVVALANFSVTLKAWVWAENAANGFELSCDLLYSIKTRFDQEGIEIPYPYQNVILKGGALPEER